MYHKVLTDYARPVFLIGNPITKGICMRTHRCKSIFLWVQAVLSVGYLTRLPIDVHVHLPECRDCRTLLRASAAESPKIFPRYQPISCDQCQADIDVFIDEEELNADHAIRTYPQIWWHLTECRDCATMYASVRAIGDAVQHHRLPAFVHRAMPSRADLPPWASITLNRSALNSAIHMQSGQFGIRRGTDNDEQMLLDEQLSEDVQIHISIHTRSNRYFVGFTIIPPIAGQVTLVSGQHQLSSPIDRAGHAILGPVQASVIADTDGPNLIFHIHRPESAG